MLGQATWKDSVDLTKGRVCGSPASWSDPSQAALRQGSSGSCKSMLWVAVAELLWILVPTGLHERDQRLGTLL